MNNFLKKIIDHFKDPTGDDSFKLPERIREDLYLNFQNIKENFIISLKTHRIVHRAKTARTSNTFYRAYAIVTSERLIHAKNSSNLKTLHEIPLNLIERHIYEENGNMPDLTVESSNSKSILTFPPNSLVEAKVFLDEFQDALNKSKDANRLCNGCGKKIPENSVYCCHCGEKTGEK